MDIDEIEYALKRGERNMGGITVDIHMDRYQRYYAYVTDNGVNLLLETPMTVGAEGRLAFCERISPTICELIKKGR